MRKIVLYEYNKKNWDDIAQVAFTTGKVLLISKERIQNTNNIFEQNDYIDLTLLLVGDEERIDLWSPTLITLFQEYLRSEYGCIFIIDKRYSRIIQETLFYFIEKRISLERKLRLDNTIQTNIVDIEETTFEELKNFLHDNLFGNDRFQRRLFDKLKSFRYFNPIGEKKIFSVFICGPTGIGKTETARLLHEFLAPSEKFIKINLGNYSDKNALSSLIGSPRGYIGSSKGELSDKIEKSNSPIILIDEFEKAGNEVHNFFLELLEDGQFTDSLGREFNLNKYIIVFTSNIKEQDVADNITPELQSRFDLMYRMSFLSNEEKINYVDYKTQKLISKFEKAKIANFNDEERKRINCIDVSEFSNLRKINRKIEENIISVIENRT